MTPPSTQRRKSPKDFVRYYPGDFARFLDFAISSLQEVHTSTEAAYRRKLLGETATSDVVPTRNVVDVALVESRARESRSGTTRLFEAGNLLS